MVEAAADRLIATMIRAREKAARNAARCVMVTVIDWLRDA
jgi:hypothetical protein